MATQRRGKIVTTWSRAVQIPGPWPCVRGPRGLPEGVASEPRSCQGRKGEGREEPSRWRNQYWQGFKLEENAGRERNRKQAGSGAASSGVGVGGGGGLGGAGNGLHLGWGGACRKTTQACAASPAQLVTEVLRIPL